MFIKCTISAWLIIAITHSISYEINNHNNKPNSNDVRQFYGFIKKYRKPYLNDSDIFNRRFQIFQKSLERHRALNARRVNRHDAWYGVNQFSDLTPEEFKAQYLSKHIPPVSSSHFDANVAEFSKSVFVTRSLNVSNVPKKFDWRNNGVIGAVRNQGTCGACWAFSIVETVSSVFAIKQKQPPPVLSPQQLIDCSVGNTGCDGGDTCRVAQWLHDYNIPIAKESDYPYKESKDICDIHPQTGIQLQSYNCLNLVNKEQQIISYVATSGPVAVAVDATTWHDYMGGIIQYHCDPYNNHAVQIVGYNLSGPVPHYIVRNQWGKGWGIDGYLLVKIGGNLCGIAQEVVSLQVK